MRNFGERNAEVRASAGAVGAIFKAGAAIVAGLAIVLAAQPAVAAAAPAQPAGPMTEIIISARPGTDPTDVAARAGAQVDRKVAGRPDLAILRVPQAAASSVAAALSSRPDVAFAAPNGTASMTAATNDPLLKHQWHLLDASKHAGSSNWEPVGSGSLGSGATVAVLDTGVTAHSDIDGLLPGYDFVSKDADASDPHGHGTHVAGTVAESSDNGIGAAGVAPGASVLPVRVLDATGNAPYDWVFSGLAFAVQNGADVVNLSLAGNVDSGMCDAVSRAVAAGVVVIAATGNDSGPVGYPAACPDAIAVGSVTMQGGIAPYSNTGPSVDLTAPGGTSTDSNLDLNPDGVLQYSVFNGKGGYYYSAGTSMASPHVAGAAAIVRSIQPAATPAQVRQALLSTATDRGPAGADSTYGAGTLNIAAVVSAAGALTPPAPAPTQSEPAPAPSEPAPAPSEPAPAPSEPAPAPTEPEPAPEETAPTQPAPEEPSTTEPEPAPAPTEPAPTEPEPEPAPSEPQPKPAPSDAGAAGVTRLSGPDRFATAAAVSADRFPAGSPHVWLATGESYADALSTGAAAGRSAGPLLLVAGCGMPDATAGELARLRPTAITVVGGPAAVCEGVIDHARALTGVQPTRVAGVDRFDTAAALSRAFWAGGASSVTLASAAGFADSLSGGALAASNDSPLLLAAACALPASTADELSRLRPSTVVVMGGQGALCEPVLDQVRALTGATVSRISGTDRFATAAQASQAGWPGGADTVYVASGQGFADGLAAGAAAVAEGAPLLLVPACGTLPESVRAELQRLNPSRVYAVGGDSAICADKLHQVSVAAAQ